METEKPYKAGQYAFLKAESFCTELLERGISFGDLVIQYAGSFRKSYRNDIEKVVVSKDQNAFTLVINRDGIYDKLPEGLFHQTRGSSYTAKVGAMVAEYRRFREEEKLARKFFQPVEQELFRYSVAVEQEERRLQFGLLNGNPGPAFYRFWNIDPGLPHKAAATLVLVMPWIKQIKGDKQLTAKALAVTLDKEVSVEEKIVYQQDEADENFVLGQQAALSVDTICGNKYARYHVQWVFSIKGLNSGEIEAFTPANAYGKFLERFEELVIPLDVEAVFTLQNPSEINCSDSGTILGYGYYL